MASPFSWSTVTPVTRSGNPDIDPLLARSKWAGPITYSFPGVNATWSTDRSTGYGPQGSATGEPWSFDYEPLSASDQSSFSQALGSWVQLTKTSATLVADTASQVGDIRAAYTSLADEPEAQAWAYNPGSTAYASDVWFNYLGSSAFRAWTPGSYEYLAAIHEIGHALGLDHPFESTPPLRTAMDSIVHTVMSYSAVPGNSSSSLSYWPTTPMVLDVAAIQYLYGANTSYHSGDDTYVYVGTSRYMETIWDGGGTDTIRAEGTRAVRIDLREGVDYGSSVGVSVTMGTSRSDQVPVNNVWIAYGAAIENATGGDAGDTLVGNALRNVLTGRGGNDTLDGLDGIDVAAYLSPRAGYKVTVAAGRPVQVTGSEGTDTLANIERVHYADIGVAFDLDGNAGAVAKLLGAVFGAPSVANANFVRIGLDFLDTGGALDNLYALALNVKLGAGYSVASEVDLLYQNLLHFQPTADVRQGWVDGVAGGQFTPVSLAELAAATSFNLTNIDLTGLSSNGLLYA